MPKNLLSVAVFVTIACAAAPSRRAPDQRNVIIVVWDGLRPDLVTPAETPNLARLREEGASISSITTPPIRPSP